MKTIRVAAAVIHDYNQIFATARGYGEFKSGWEFPGGKIEENETPEQALVREIKEELDIDIRVGELIETIEYDYPVSVGRIGKLESDFIPRDNYPKYVVTIDSLLQQRNGISHINLVDFMKNRKEF